MQIDIRTTAVTPLRQTFGHVARRIGSGKPASRYQEATFDLQPEVNFHYRPYWDAGHELYDASRTAIVMDDWYACTDPRQYYYGAWTQTRARQQEVMERNFAFVEQRGLPELLDEGWKRRVAALVLPLRHVEYAANLNNTAVAAYGYGAALTQAASFCAMDRLGIAQYLTRIGLLLDSNGSALLDAAKADWLHAVHLQPLRRLCEDLLVVEDWFELLLAQDFVLDGLLYPLVYERIEAEFSREAGTTLALLSGFMDEWYAEHTRWIDQQLKVVAAASAANRERVAGWCRQWSERVRAALLPLASEVFGDGAEAVLDELEAALQARAQKKCGLSWAPEVAA